MDIIKVLGICLAGGFVSLILRQYKSEYAFAAAITTCAVIVLFLARESYTPLLSIFNIIEECGANTECFKVALKALGISYITEFIADALRDSGEASIANKAELAGKFAIFLISLPLIISVLNTAIKFI